MCTAYIRMAGAEFMRAFHRSHKLKKSAEHRKKVLQRQQKLQRKKEKVTLQEIQNDNSTKKAASHALLVAYHQKHEIQGVMKACTIKELKKLLNAYGIQLRSSAKKKVLMELFIQALDTQTCIPYPSYVYDLQVSSFNSEGRFVVRFRRVPQQMNIPAQ